MIAKCLAMIARHDMRSLPMLLDRMEETGHVASQAMCQVRRYLVKIEEFRKRQRRPRRQYSVRVEIGIHHLACRTLVAKAFGKKWKWAWLKKGGYRVKWTSGCKVIRASDRRVVYKEGASSERSA
jgi:hypothetical protein